MTYSFAQELMALQAHIRQFWNTTIYISLLFKGGYGIFLCGGMWCLVIFKSVLKSVKKGRHRPFGPYLEYYKFQVYLIDIFPNT